MSLLSSCSFLLEEVKLDTLCLCGNHTTFCPFPTSLPVARSRQPSNQSFQAGRMYRITPLFIFLTILISKVLSHPLNLLHAHHHHHTHHHLHLRLPFRSSAAKAVPQLQNPLGNNPVQILDLSNIFVNMTLRSSESSAPTSFLIPLRASSPQEDAVELTSPTFHHPRTARISNIQYGVAPRDSSEQFERSGDVVCSAHTRLPASRSERQNAQRGSQSLVFRESDGEVDFAESGGRWFVAEGMVSSFSCSLGS